MFWESKDWFWIWAAETFDEKSQDDETIAGRSNLFPVLILQFTAWSELFFTDTGSLNVIFSI